MDDATNIARVTERLLRDGATLRVNERLELGGKRKFYNMKNNMENKDSFFVKRKNTNYLKSFERTLFKTIVVFLKKRIFQKILNEQTIMWNKHSIKKMAFLLNERFFRTSF